MLDSLLTPSPVFAYRHVDDEQYQGGIYDEADSGPGIGIFFLAAFFVLGLVVTVEQFRRIKKGEEFDPKRRTLGERSFCF